MNYGGNFVIFESDFLINNAGVMPQYNQNWATATSKVVPLFHVKSSDPAAYC